MYEVSMHLYKVVLRVYYMLSFDSSCYCIINIYNHFYSSGAFEYKISLWYLDYWGVYWLVQLSSLLRFLEHILYNWEVVASDCSFACYLGLVFYWTSSFLYLKLILVAFWCLFNASEDLHEILLWNPSVWGNI